MNTKDLKDAVNGIDMRDEMKKEVVRNVMKQTGKKRKGMKTFRWQKVAAAAVIVIAAGGVIGVPVRAFVNSYVRERMEEMNKEEKEAFVDAIDRMQVDPDSLSREYTENEKERQQTLYQQYVQGVFPESELPQVDSEKEAEQYEFCYLRATGKFYLPERELTDEELLEIIDFTLKGNYSITQRYEEEYAEEIAKTKEQTDEEIKAIVEEGGITQQQAEEIATKYLLNLYNVTGQGLNFDCNYKGADDEFTGVGEENYLACWQDIVNHDNYFICISAHDGRLIGLMYSGEKIPEDGIKAEEAEEKISVLHAKAADLIKKDRKETYQKEYIFYEKYDDDTTTESVKFIFEKEDGSVYTVEYGWNGMLSYYGEDDLSDYHDGIGRTRFIGNQGKRVESVFKQF